MRKMKDSGIEWLGMIPEDWETERLQWHISEIKESNKPEKSRRILSLTNKRGVIPYEEKGAQGNVAKEDYTQYKLAYPGTIVANSMNILIGSVGKCDYFGCVSPVYYVFKPNNGENLEFINYIFQTEQFQKELRRYANGILEIRLRVSSDGILKRKVPFPSIYEQDQIVSTIESSTSKVDALIANVQEQIEKLKAYKQSLITEVVTKGLDPNVPMKDSGVEWIGEIPKCWNMVRGKALFEECDARSDDGSEELLTVSQYTGVTPRSQKSVNMFESTTLEGYKICEVGDIAANTMWLWAGAIGVSEYRGVISPSYNVYRQKEIKYISSYLDCLLRIPLLVQEYASRSTGIRASRLRLYPKDFMDIMFPVPPIEEQKTIMDILGKKIDMVNQMISIKQSKIEKLEQYKRSLIYEYVTGKKEVS